VFPYFKAKKAFALQGFRSNFNRDFDFYSTEGLVVKFIQNAYAKTWKEYSNDTGSISHTWVSE
jgi:hypothetical protein